MDQRLALSFVGAAVMLACAHTGPSPERGKNEQTVLDVAYGTFDANKLDLYLTPARARAPVLILFHGGGLMEGDKSEAAFAGRRFASAGIVTVVPNYRLSPGVSHPVHVEDAAAVVGWVKLHIGEYGGDAERVVVAGHSAGAYLAALLALDERYLGRHGLAAKDVRGIVAISAFYWVERAGVAPDRDKSVWGSNPQSWVDASPAHHIHARLPPITLLYADGDEEWRRHQNEEMAEVLRQAGNSEVTLRQIPNRDHESIWAGIANEGDPVADAVTQFVHGL